jgi:acetyl-CoA carboxylase biotin carboxyl carrier protein
MASPNSDKAPSEKSLKSKAKKKQSYVKVCPELKMVQDAILLMDSSELYELHFEQDHVKIYLRRGPNGIPMPVHMPLGGANIPMAVPSASAENTVSAPENKPPDDKTVKIESPMVGTFYRSPSPDAKPFINEGDEVQVGQILGIIEAMKLMNEIKFEIAGRVVKILVPNGHPVEFGQPLVIIDPK